MSQYDFDEIVIGAGMAGLACAGELVLQGRRPLLISETEEVGAMYKPFKLDEGNFGFVQQITHQPSWDGGWWLPLARALNIPVQVFPGSSFCMALEGGVTVDVPFCVSAGSFINAIERLGIPLGESRDVMERVLNAALAIPHRELLTMHEEPLSDWLGQQDADPMTMLMILTFAGSMNGMTPAEAGERLSVFGGIGSLRAVLFLDGGTLMTYPDIRTGFCIPLAQEIERRGGTVWRGRKVKQVLVENGQAQGVLLMDGTEVQAQVVAVATGNARLPKLLDPLPPELEEPLSRSEQAKGRDLAVFMLLGKPVVQRSHQAVVLVSASGTFEWVVPLHGVAPWCVEPDKQLVMTWLRQEPGAEAIDDDKAIARAIELGEAAYSGFKDAIVKAASDSRPHEFNAPLLIGPKVPRTVESVRGLFFVGDGSFPTAGIWSEGAASNGILGAREILRHK